MSRQACELSRLDPIYNDIPTNWFECTRWAENDCRKKPDNDSVLIQDYIPPCLCFFRRSKRQYLSHIQYSTSNRYQFQADLFQPISGKGEQWESQAGWRNLLGESFRARNIRPSSSWSLYFARIQTDTACLENIQILAIPIAANQYPVWKSGTTSKGSLERLEVLAGRASPRVRASTANFQRGSKRPNIAR
jgi:hypothetical protein